MRLSHYKNLKPHARSIAVLMGVVLLFASGVFISRFIDNRLNEFVKDGLDRLRDKYGIQVSVGSMDTGLGTVTLSEITVGWDGWLVIDRIDLSISFKPGRDFMRLSSLEIGQVTSKIPWLRDQWPQELELLVRLISKERVGDESNENSETSLRRRLMPQTLKVKAARVEIADGTTTKILGENISMIAVVPERRAQFRVGHIAALNRIEESFIEGDASFGSGEKRFILKSRQGFRGDPQWKVTCAVAATSDSGSCDVAASQIPLSLVRPLQRKFGSEFAPGFQGRVQFTPATTAGWEQGAVLDIDGKFDGIVIENQVLALIPVGPFSTIVKSRLRVDRGKRFLMLEPSRLTLLPPKSKIIDPGVGLPIDISGDVTFMKKNDGSLALSAGSIKFDIQDVGCGEAIKAIPGTFIPELAKIRLGGTAALHGKAKFISGNSDVSIEKSRFDCVVRETPEIYSANYLNAPFEIEREVVEGKIHIPVDPERPYFASYASVPVLTRAAFISSEDTGFFAHKGVEVAAIVGALERNTEAGRAAVGGSTITMQTVKNLFLARDKTVSRKAQEMFLAWHLERTISKERILEIYLNMVEFGPGLYGIGRASQRFFGKEPGQLTLKESIYLASLLPAPVPRYRYFCKGELTPNYNRIVTQLLDRMLSLGRISSSQRALAAAETLRFSSIERDSSCGVSTDEAAEQDSDERRDLN